MSAGEVSWKEREEMEKKNTIERVFRRKKRLRVNYVTFDIW